jgi:hypothetical protein
MRKPVSIARKPMHSSVVDHGIVAEKASWAALAVWVAASHTARVVRSQTPDMSSAMRVPIPENITVLSSVKVIDDEDVAHTARRTMTHESSLKLAPAAVGTVAV